MQLHAVGVNGKVGKTNLVDADLNVLIRHLRVIGTVADA